MISCARPMSGYSIGNSGTTKPTVRILASPLSPVHPDEPRESSGHGLEVYFGMTGIGAGPFHSVFVPAWPNSRLRQKCVQRIASRWHFQASGTKRIIPLADRRTGRLDFCRVQHALPSCHRRIHRLPACAGPGMGGSGGGSTGKEIGSTAWTDARLRSFDRLPGVPQGAVRYVASDLPPNDDAGSRSRNRARRLCPVEHHQLPRGHRRDGSGGNQLLHEAPRRAGPLAVIADCPHRRLPADAAIPHRRRHPPGPAARGL